MADPVECPRCDHLVMPTKRPPMMVPIKELESGEYKAISACPVCGTDLSDTQKAHRARAERRQAAEPAEAKE
jgi:DNA-directed RNA polymerase subunit RPC12/RpoP